MVVSLIRAGELSGKLGEVLDQSAALLERELKLRRTLSEGLIYPAFLALLIGSAIVVISTVIVPRILKQFTGQISASQLPLPTRMVMGLTDFVQSWWWMLLGLTVAAILLLSNFYRQPAGRLAIDRFLLSVPALGKVLRDVAVARFTRVLATLVSAGLPALTSLRITKGALGNKAMEEAIEDVCNQVAAGKTIAEPMEDSGYFPPLLTQIMGVGERSGRLPQMLAQAAGVFEDRTQSSIRVFTQLFPLIMVIFAAIVVGFVVAAVLLPLVQMQDLIR
jgi:type II secretory pathway component PulF